MTTIDIDGMSEEEFRRSIEGRLRQGLAGKAVEKLRAQLAPFAGPGGILPERFMTVTADELTLGGWEALSDAMRRHDRPGRPITALSVTFGWPGDDVPKPDAEGRLSPVIETSYYTDDAFPFSQSSREDLLDGYSYHGCTWTGDCEATDTALWLTGIDDLHGALAQLEARLLASDEPDAEGIRAGSIGACLLSALLFQVVDARIALGGMARPLCVMAGSNGVYPYFDAPVAGFPEDARKAAEAADDEATLDAGVPAPRYSSLLVTGIPRAKKRAVLVLAETADEEAARIARLRGLAHAAPAAEAMPETPAPLRSDGSIAAAPDSPLLAKKPAGQAWDFREMLSPYEPDAASPEPEPLEPEQDWDEAEPIAAEADWGGAPPSEPQDDWEGPPSFEPAQDRGSTGPIEPEQDWGDDEPIGPEPDLGEAEPLELEQAIDEAEPLDPAPDWGDAVPVKPAEAPLPVLSGSAGAAPVGPGFSLLEVFRKDRQQSIFPLPDFHTVVETEEPELEPAAPISIEPAPIDFSEPDLVAEPEPELTAPGLPVSAEAIAPTSFAAPEPAPPSWPSDPAWLREVEARILPKTNQGESESPRQRNIEPFVAKSLWAQVRDWWYGRR